jgi:serine protease inhibitor
MRIATICLFAFVLACAAPAAASAQKTDADVQALVDGNNDFGLTLYGQLATKDGNVFFSPYSISNALAMTYAGARGNTAEEMKTTLRFGLAAERVHPAFGKLITSLDGDVKKGKRPFQLTVANRLWGQKDYGFLPEFTKLGKDYYRAGLEEVDFVNATEDARMTINTWVEKQTNDKIKDLLPKGSLTVDSRLVLTNAIYFKAPWLTPFNEKKTAPGDFNLASGKSVKASVMHAKERIGYAAFDSFSLVNIPYDGYQQSMVVLLPKKNDGLPELEKQLTAANLSAWLKKMGSFEVDLKLPKFKVTAEFMLNDVLIKMGMKDAFSRNKADFTGIASREKLFITAVVHKAFVDVNEAGTEAAAATGVVVGTTSLPQPATFHADHPFVFLIRDNRTGSILFAGRVVDPTK